MNRQLCFAASAALVFSSFVYLAPQAMADDTTAAPAPAPEALAVSVTRGQFASKVEGGKPVGDASDLRPGQMATYWVEVSSPKAPATVTLVWKADGVETARQTLDVGRAPAWRTWGHSPIRKNVHALEVHVLDAAGTELRTDSMTVMTGDASSADAGLAAR